MAPADATTEWQREQLTTLLDELRAALLAYGPLAKAEEAPHNPHQE